ncbi:MAG TPA: hypothetical protein VHD88_00070 [Pyrinomonadaceae bacterium]|nr:hypothetical protein [Pyrinomonadaceae bacterium]
MRLILSRKFVGAVVCVAALLGSLALAFTKARSIAGKSATTTNATRAAQVPQVVLWAWERPVDLHFINPRQTGVAFLARTIRLHADEVVVRPRLQPLNLPEESRVIAVARVEADPRSKPDLSSRQSEKLADAIAEMAQLPNVANVQIDFGATRSERDFYRGVIIGVRQRLPEAVGLSITALASWCTDDDWLSDLPIDEAVPMLFRMGPDRQRVQNRIASGEEFAAEPCRGSYGISTDEPLRNLSIAKRLYVFNPDPWTENSVRSILESRK